MNNYLDKLLNISSAALSNDKPELSKALCLKAGNLEGEFIGALEKKNGFVAFEGALRFFPLGASKKIVNLELWNDESIWVEAYGDLVQETLFFAEDILVGNSEFIKMQFTVLIQKQVNMSSWRIALTIGLG